MLRRLENLIDKALGRGANSDVMLARLMYYVAHRISGNHAATMEAFRRSETFGWHFLPAHFYSPVPHLGSLEPSVWQARYDALPGLEWPVDQAAALLAELGAYADELRRMPTEATEGYYFNNISFGHSDACLLYALVRHRKPARIIEVGSGMSTLLSISALAANGSGRITCIEPYPNATIQTLGREGRVELVAAPVQSVPLAMFAELDAGDILFIDSTHVSKIGSDVNYELLQILPRLKPGVAVHIHDIFLPHEYPEAWVKDLHLFWNEQYIFAAFMAFNANFTTIARSAVLTDEPYAGLCRQHFAGLPAGGSSYWIERTS